MSNNLTVDRGRPEPTPATPPRPSTASTGPGGIPGSGETDLPGLLIAYLSAVAAQLAGHDILVRAVRVDEVVRHGEPTLTGSLTLAPAVGRSRWAPNRVRWDEDSGWSAFLGHTTEPGLGAVSRHLTGQLVPAPMIVAHFVFELAGNPNTIWATALEQHPSALDRRHLAMELAGYAYP